LLLAQRPQHCKGCCCRSPLAWTSFRCSSWGQAHDRPRASTSTTRPACDGRCGCQLPQALTAEIATRADTGGWPAARFLAFGRNMNCRSGHAPHQAHSERGTNYRQAMTLANLRLQGPCQTLPRAAIEAPAGSDWLTVRGKPDRNRPIPVPGKTAHPVWRHSVHALVRAGHRVFYTRTAILVQRLQAATTHLVLEAALAKLDKSNLIILDDITLCPRRIRLENRRPLRT